MPGNLSKCVRGDHEWGPWDESLEQKRCNVCKAYSAEFGFFPSEEYLAYAKEHNRKREQERLETVAAIDKRIAQDRIGAAQHDDRVASELVREEFEKLTAMAVAGKLSATCETCPNFDDGTCRLEPPVYEQVTAPNFYGVTKTQPLLVRVCVERTGRCSHHPLYSFWAIGETVRRCSGSLAAKAGV